MKRALALAGMLIVTAGIAVADQTRHLPRETRSTTVPSFPGNDPFPGATPFAQSTAAPATSRVRKQLPPIPPPPPPGKNNERRRHTQSANGTFVYASPGTGCGGAYYVSYPVGCQVFPFIVAPGFGINSADEQLYYLAPNAPGNAPVAIGGFTPVTLGQQGYWVFGAYNNASNQWDDLMYVLVGSAPSIQAYDTSGNAVVTFVPNGTARLVFTATGLTNGDKYAVSVESTSVTGQCAFISNQTVAPTGSPTGSLCNVSGANAGINAVGGTMSASWIPPATINGTFNISLWDVTTGTPVRVSYTQMELRTSQYAVGASRVVAPNWDFADNVGLSVPRTIFAFYSVEEANNTGASVSDIFMNIKDPNASAGRQYESSVTDPSGNGINSTLQSYTGVAANAYLTSTYDFPLKTLINTYIGPQLPLYTVGYTNPVFTAQLMNSNGTAMTGFVASTSFKVVGFSSLAQWQVGSSLTDTLQTGASTFAIAPIVFTNNGDSVFGPGNSDSISGYNVYFTHSIGSGFGLVQFASGNPTTQTFTDSGGNVWTATIIPGGGGVDDLLTVTPNNSAVSVPPNATLTTPPINVSAGASGCKNNNCSLYVRVKPTHGNGNYSADPNVATHVAVVNPLQFVNGTLSSGGNAYASIQLVGYVNPGGGAVTGVSVAPANPPVLVPAPPEAHRYRSRNTQSVYLSQDLSMPGTGLYDVFALTVGTGQGNATFLQIQMPPGYDVTNVLQSSQLTGLTGGTTWTAQRCASAPTARYICFSNGSLKPINSPQAIYFAVPPPTQASSYYSIPAQINAAAGFAAVGTNVMAAAVASIPVYVGNFPSTVDSLSLATYSLDATLMSALFSPSTVQQNASTGYPVTLQFNNANLSIGNFPDYVDTVVLEVPTANTVTANGTSSPTGWTLAGTTTNGANTQYWFTICPEQVPSTTYGPNATVGSGSLNYPACANPALEQSTSVAPAQNVNFPIKVVTATANVVGNVYAHGANNNGWSKPIPTTLKVSASAAASGFVRAGTYGNPATVAVGAEPTVGIPASQANGNSYYYEMTNSGNANITSFLITIPGKDTSGAVAFDGTETWTLNGTPTIVAAQGDTLTYGCTVSTTYPPVSATSAGANGYIFVTGCALPAGKSVDVSFNAKTPVTQGSAYAFPSSINGASPTDPSAIAAGEKWYSDQLVLVTVTTSVQVFVPNAANSYSYLTPATLGAPNPTACGTGTCTYSTGPNTVDFGTIGQSTQRQLVDSVLFRITNAVAPRGWKLYLNSTYNTAKVGATGMELQVQYDQAVSYGTGTAGAGTNASSGTGWLDIPTTTPGLQVVDTGATAAVQTPYDLFMNMGFGLGTETPAQTSATVTFTWIAN